ncbi:hypothetical protein PT184_08040 [Erysipelothrix rhusiopathiae]|nr:hypothetical protein [Erysipelothrix rhusiopathiae]MDE8203870.1 hypothetical protein [Erysipelothrix rhusiopathiae]MDE8258482.1 hypothetical protein [Erysipelothrix rhusiopathiae]MDE8301474.1 hypothetical protein [Erysipelothrix rhusiopathiae]MDE8306564.1 hypothetical protein [Erysipelothrix rhusiopathiae]
MFILTFFERIPITLATTILANIDNSISISNWPDYKFSFPEFLINHLLPIILTTFLTLLITWIYDKSRNRELLKSQFIEQLEKYIEEYLIITEEILKLANPDFLKNDIETYLLLRSRFRLNHNRTILLITKFDSTMKEITKQKFAKKRNRNLLEKKLKELKQNFITSSDEIQNALDVFTQEGIESKENYDIIFLRVSEIFEKSNVFNLSKQLLQIIVLLY